MALRSCIILCVGEPGSTLELESRDGSHELDQREPLLLALMIAWAPWEPERVGEVAFFDADGGARILGRGEPEGEEGKRAVFFRQRPGGLERGGPLRSRGLSREQLRVCAVRDRLHIERVGKCRMRVAGKHVDRCSLVPGEMVLLRGQLLLYCTLRPRNLAALANGNLADAPLFGEPDAHGIVGESLVAWRLRDQLAWVAKADEHTLLLGESGSGKELCARAVHRLSPVRARGPFVARNAATIPAGIIDAELFGNVKNYPNPGMPERQGLIGSAHGGMLFLDEIAELPSSLQANLLRVLDEGGEYHVLGGTTTKQSQFRLLAATNRGPETLKHDLAARLVMRVVVPGLDERREDIPLLVRHSLRRALEKSPDAVGRFFKASEHGMPEPNMRSSVMEALMGHSYTTNIRELQALLWSAMSSSSGDVIEWKDDAIAANLGQKRPDEHEDAAFKSEELPKEPTESEVRASLAEHRGNIVRTTESLGLSSRYVLYRLMRKYGIRRE